METSRFFNSIGGDRRHLAEDWAAYFSSFIGNGVFPVPSSGLQVIAGISGTNVILRAGKAWINGYFYTNEDELPLQLSIADGVLPRIDRIVIRWCLLERRLFAMVKEGVPASNPQTPALQRDTDIWELGLADVRVNAGATNLTQANITDTRWNTALCGVVAGVVQQIDPTFITAQFQAFFAEMMPRIEADYAFWAENIQNHFELYVSLVGARHAQFENLLDSITRESADAYRILLEWLANFKTQSTEEFEKWFNDLRDLLDDNQAGNLLNLIQRHAEKTAITQPDGVHGIRFSKGFLEINIGEGWLRMGQGRLANWRYRDSLQRSWFTWGVLAKTWMELDNMKEVIL